MTRFKEFLKDIIRDEQPELDGQKLMIEAGERIEKMKRDRIPPELFRQALIWFNIWWKANKSEQKIQNRVLTRFRGILLLAAPP